MLTGKTRYRLGWGKRLVLQVEHLTMVGGMYPRLGNLWRDATVEDLQVLHAGDIVHPKDDSASVIPQPWNDQ